MRTILQVLTEIRPEFDFTTSRDFISDGMLDSFDIVTLVSALDRTYGISIPGAAIVPENFQNVESIQLLCDRSERRPV